ncbi:MAG: hypothetical protein GTN81_11995 [Proteobacteria bacterium]|nr:hypothetical protein [Pseudomonadota bacterium]
MPSNTKSFYRIELDIIPKDNFEINEFLGLLGSALQSAEDVLNLKVNRIERIFEDGYLFPD